MKRTIRVATLLLVPLTGCVLSVACGGGGGGGGTGGGGGVIPPVVTSVVFTPATPAGGIAMASPGPSGATFSVDVNANAIDDLFGTAFRVNFDSATASFVGTSSVGSILTATGAQTQISAQSQGAGQVAVVATLVGQGFCSAASTTPGANCTTAATCTNGTCLGGINNATGRLVRLNFQATQATAANVFTFATAGRGVTVCPTAGQACTDPSVTAGTLSFTGGTMVAN